jgi:uncharacterized protein (TIGR02300 family)
MGGDQRSFWRGIHVTKAELGIKRVCPNCGTKYYDLNRSPIVCPRCGTVFEATTVARARPQAAAKPAPPVVEEEAAEAPETVSLEQADEEAADSGQVKVDADDEEAEESGEEETFLEEDEEDGGDVGDIIGDVEDEEP